MGDHENCVLSTRSSSKKRVSVAQSSQLPTTKKRVVLADLTNSPDFGSTQNSDLHTHKTECQLKNENSPSAAPSQKLDFETPKPKGELQKKKNQELTKVGIDESSGDLKKCIHSSSMYRHLHSLEIELNGQTLSNYIEEVQNDVSANMREILVDWLVEVAEEYKLVSDTLYLTISYIDRFLSVHALSRNKLQLLGISCMLIASKYEEISPPHVEDFCYITDNTYTKEEVVDMEKDILQVLNFEMGTPTTKNFLRILTRAAQENCKSPYLQLEFLGCYLTELSLLDYGCVRFLPSVVAASAIFLSRFTIQPNMHPWSLELQCYTGYRPSDLKECVLAIHDLQLNRRGNSLQAVRDKYMQHKFKQVALLVSPSEVPAHYFEAIDE